MLRLRRLRESCSRVEANGNDDNDNDDDDDGSTTPPGGDSPGGGRHGRVRGRVVAPERRQCQERHSERIDAHTNRPYERDRPRPVAHRRGSRAPREDHGFRRHNNQSRTVASSSSWWWRRRRRRMKRRTNRVDQRVADTIATRDTTTTPWVTNRADVREIVARSMVE